MTKGEERVSLHNMMMFIRDGGQVRRWHTWPIIKEDTVAAHSFGVAWLCVLMYNFKPSVELLLAAMQHDLAEYAVGDMPAQVKLDDDMNRAMNVLEDRAIEKAGMPRFPLTEEERLVLIFADKLEALWFMVQERKLGNRNTSLVVHRTHIYLGKLLAQLTTNSVRNNARNLLDELLTQHRDALGEV